MKYSLMVSLVLVLTACVSSGRTDPDTARVPNATPAELTHAATAPLTDLNLVRAEIPPILSAAQKEPYAAPGDGSCAGLANEIQALDAVLGADLDTPATASNPGLVERGTQAAGDAAVDLVRGTAEGLVPFRSWVRKLTGAERYAREVAAAIAAGTIRRAFLKGLGEAADCPAPASPRR
jgi:hypothetical protein